MRFSLLKIWIPAFLCNVALGLLTCLADKNKPNIIFIIADDLGYGDVQCMNPTQGKIPTPNLDRLAAEGKIFTDAHSASSVCTPTRYGVLTGRYSWRTRLQKGVIREYSPPLIASDRLTVASFLKQQGYHSACIGKWHLGFTLDQMVLKQDEVAPLGARTSDGPTTRGFDFYFGFHHAAVMKALFTNDHVTELIEPVQMLARTTEIAVDYVSKRAAAEQPFFLYFALNSPHTPITPSAQWEGKSGLGHYADFVMETDWAVGEILQALQDSGVSSSTLVIFTSDNGCSPKANVQQLERQGHQPSAGRRGYKSDLWEGGHRVPFIVRWPGKVAPGTSTNQMISLNDLLATSAAILGVTLPQQAAEDSVSILPLLLGNDPTPVRESVVHHSIQGKFSIREGSWKLILAPGSGGWSKPTDEMARKNQAPPVQLYDLSTDPNEERNLATEQPRMVQHLTKLLQTYVDEGRSTPGPKMSNDVAVDIFKEKD